MRIRLADLVERSNWWELAGHETSSLADAWCQAHHAVQPAAELSKAFAIPESDDSHTAFEWVNGRVITDGYLRGRLIETPRGVIRSALRLFDMTLFLINANGDLYAELPLAGSTVEQAHGWVLTTTMNLFDIPIRQVTEAATGLPNHAVARGEPFAEPNQLALIEVVRLYTNTASMLAAMDGPAHEPSRLKPDVLCWPHHFDLARLFVLGETGEGAMKSTIGTGLTPPDSLSTCGYWYVSPWEKQREFENAPPMPPLPFGGWHQRDGQRPMAMLGIDALGGIEDQREQHEIVSAFLAAAFNICAEALETA